MSLVSLFVFGIAVGVMSGLLGIGGGIVLVPGLMLLFGLTQHEAQGTSLMVLSLPILACAAAVYYQQGHVRLPTAGLIAAGFVIGAFCGAKLIPHVPPAALRIAFGALLLNVGFLFVIDVRTAQSKAVLPTAMAMLLAYLFRRKRLQRSSLEPPGEHLEYHI